MYWTYNNIFPLKKHVNINKTHDTDIYFPLSPAKLIIFQGCEKMCPGCSNGFAHNIFEMKRLLSVKEFIGLIGDSETVVYSGGEPLLPFQIPALYKIMKVLRARKKNQILYTGFKYSDLIENKINYLRKYHKLITNILNNYADIIIDGEYIESLRITDDMFRGSSNQNVIFNNDNLKLIYERCEIKNTLEINITYTGNIEVYGFLKKVL